LPRRPLGGRRPPRLMDLSRRDFIRLSLAVGAGLLIEVRSAAEPPDGAYAPNAWIRIGVDGVVTIILAKSEMGQGVMTAMAMLVAEELECDWSSIRVEAAPVDSVYIDPKIGTQSTGASWSVSSSWRPLREAGAEARELLIGAAARLWGEAPSACSASGGFVTHAASGRRAPFGELSRLAAAAPPSPRAAVELKPPERFTLIGKPLGRLDQRLAATGAKTFGIDVRVPGSLVAVVARCPMYYGALDRFDASRALKLRGVRGVFEIASGVAVVADDYWSALKAREALTIEWKEPRRRPPYLDSGAMSEGLDRIGREAGKTLRSSGDVSRAEASAAKIVEAVYDLPYLAHATAEPMNCTARIGPDGCDVWVPTQNQTTAQKTAAAVSGLPLAKVRVHTTFLGCGLGRRTRADFVAEAVEIAMKASRPVKLIWTREDDFKHGFFRPATRHRLRGALDSRGRLSAWTHLASVPTASPAYALGSASFGYEIPHVKVVHAGMNFGAPTGAWRSTGYSNNVFASESFMDEVAHAAGADPLRFRLDLLRRAPRQRAVLETAALRARWGERLSSGRGRGLASFDFGDGAVAVVVEASVSPDGAIRAERITAAADCGAVVNPGIVEAQLEGAIAMGLSSALMERITLKDARVVESNYHDYPILRADRMPPVEIHLVASKAEPSGIGEAGVPGVAPALANAVFAAGGGRVRALPMRPA